MKYNIKASKIHVYMIYVTCR